MTYLNLIGLPNQIDSFLPNNLNLSHFIAGLLIVGVILLLIWTILELYRGNKKLYLK
ncbi:Manganese transport protein MntH [Lactococcus cremoris subsp. cremoris A76]|nr:Manganese transport protein MntH [Lactococcus cremoris subsp. cremoris A76]